MYCGHNVWKRVVFFNSVEYRVGKILRYNCHQHLGDHVKQRQTSIFDVIFRKLGNAEPEYFWPRLVLVDPRAVATIPFIYLLTESVTSPAYAEVSTNVTGTNNLGVIRFLRSFRGQMFETVWIGGYSRSRYVENIF